MKLKGILLFVSGIVIGCLLALMIFSGINYSLTGNVILEPKDYVNERDIFAYEDRIVIFIDNASVGNYASTGSMIPFLGRYSNGIKVIPKVEDEINVGDIVSFRKNGELVVHRVVQKGYDSEGVFFVTKGDNNFFSDEKIRFENIESVTIGIIY